MAKALTMPTAPEAPMAPQVSIGDRIHNIENRIEEIEGISGINGSSKSRDSSGRKNQQQNEEAEEVADDQEEEQSQVTQQTQPQRSQPIPQQRKSSPQNVTTPETMARDAVANGSGALTKRTTTRSKDDTDDNASDTGSQAKNQSTIVIPPNSALNDNGQTNFERGRAVLNEFKQLDKEEATSGSDKNQSTTSTPGLFTPSSNSDSQHGAAYWLFTVVAVVILAFVFIRQFMINKKSPTEEPFKPSLAKPQISNQAAIDKYNQSKFTSIKNSEKSSTSTSIPKINPMPPIPKVKPVTLKSKPANKTEDDNKGNHFEVRV